MIGYLAQFGGWLLSGLISIAPTLVGQALIALGIGVATYSGMSASIDFLKAGVVSSFLGLPPEVVGMLSLMKVGSCLSMVFSAMGIRMAIQGVTGASFKRWTKT